METTNNSMVLATDVLGAIYLVSAYIICTHKLNAVYSVILCCCLPFNLAGSCLESPLEP